MSHSNPGAWHKYAAEVLGTFCLVFVGTGSILAGGPKAQLLDIALAFALVIMAMIYSIGDVSGCHINPAVTVGLWLARRFPLAGVFPYVASQVMGAFLASGLLRALFSGSSNLGSTQPAGSEIQSFILEIIATGLLVYVILSVTSGSKEKGILAGLAISGTIAFEIIFFGPVTGASMNPARSLAPAVVSGTLAHLWIYVTAPFVGAAAGVTCWRITHGHVCRSEKETE